MRQVINKNFLFFFLIIFFLYSFKKWQSEDEIHQSIFNKKYSIFSLNKILESEFANEKVPLENDFVWERFDKELLKNVYWQSNTILYLKRANRYFPIIDSILNANKIPVDFRYLAVIESGLENVRSPSGASGIWQIMRSTAKEYGIEVNRDIDERYNLEIATQFACDYLNKAFEEFNNWTIAAASYNMGINGMRSNLKKQNVESYYDLNLNSETSRYIFRILAVKTIFENPKKYGFNIRSKDLYQPLSYKYIHVSNTINNLYEFSEKKNINYQTLKFYNPWLRSSRLPDASRKLYKIKLPN